MKKYTLKKNFEYIFPNISEIDYIQLQHAYRQCPAQGFYIKGSVSPAQGFYIKGSVSPAQGFYIKGSLSPAQGFYIKGSVSPT